MQLTYSALGGSLPDAMITQLAKITTIMDKLKNVLENTVKAKDKQHVNIHNGLPYSPSDFQSQFSKAIGCH